MNILKAAAQWLFILCLPALLLTASVSAAANCPYLYKFGFEKYDISRVSGLAPAELDKAAAGLIGYFNNDEEFINITVEKNGRPFQLFNDKEVAHLKDVKGLFRLVYKILLGTGVYALVFAAVSLFWWREKRRLGRALFFGGGLTLAVMLVTSIIMAIDFDWFFLQFHMFSFANDLWLLNPATDYLIMMFPQGFWLDAALACAAATAAGALISGGAGWWLMRRKGLTA